MIKKKRITFYNGKNIDLAVFDNEEVKYLIKSIYDL